LDARAVDQHAFLPVRVARLGEGGVHRLVGRHVGLAEHAADLRGDAAALVLVPVEDRDPGALGGERPRGGFAEAGCRARDDRGNAFDVHAVTPYPRTSAKAGTYTRWTRR